MEQGGSELHRLQYLDLVGCTVVDLMHNLYTGTAKGMAQLLQRVEDPVCVASFADQEAYAGDGGSLEDGGVASEVLPDVETQNRVRV